jgi:hypothetical protein
MTDDEAAEVARLIAERDEARGEYLAERTARMEANSREAIPLDDGEAAAALWAAGADTDTARFIARQLRANDKAIVNFRFERGNDGMNARIDAALATENTP